MVNQSLFDGMKSISAFKQFVRVTFPYVVTRDTKKNGIVVSTHSANILQIHMAKKIFGLPRYSFRDGHYSKPMGNPVFKLIFDEDRNNIHSEWLHFKYCTYFKTEHDAMFFRMALSDDQVC